MVAATGLTSLVDYSFIDGIHAFVILKGSVRALDIYADKLGAILQSNPELPVRILYDNTHTTLAPMRYTYDQLVARRLSIGAPLPLRVAYLVNNGIARDTLMGLVEKKRLMDLPETRRRIFLAHQRNDAIAWLNEPEF